MLSEQRRVILSAGVKDLTSQILKAVCIAFIVLSQNHRITEW